MPEAIAADGGAQPTLVKYRMPLDESGWKVYDIIVGGVSLVTTYRSSFASEIQTNGMDGLIERLSAKNREDTGS